MKRSRWVVAGMMMVLVLCLVSLEDRAEALSVTSLDFTSGAVNFDGRDGRILDQLFAQDGTIAMGSYQSMSDIVDPITRGHKTFSLFTSGLNGAPAPSGTVNGSSISVDLSSLFFGWTRGSEVRAWNIGGIATGLFDPQTNEFSLSWDHLFTNGIGKGGHEGVGNEEHGLLGNRSATFFLQGTAVVAQAPIPLSSSLMFFATGMALICGFLWRKSDAVSTGAVS